jgi:hypothetical protein
MEIKCVLCYSIPHLRSVCTHITVLTTWLGWVAKSVMGIRKLQLSSKEKKLFLGTANTGGALNPPPPQCYAYAHNLSNLLNPNTDMGSKADTASQAIQP